MLVLILYTSVFITLATGTIDSDKFYNVNEEMPSHRQSKILSPSDSNVIQVSITKPSNEEYFHGDSPVEQVSVGVETSQSITPEGKQLVGAISSQLRFVQDHPVALLVQDDEEVQRAAAIYMTYIMRNPMVRNDFWLMKFNASGVSNIIAQSSRTDPVEFNHVIITESSKTKQNLGADRDSAAVFFSILKASRQLPFGSGILLFVNARVEDEDLAQLAIRETMAKQIRIFAVWQSATTNNQEDKLIKEATSLTHGHFFIGNTERKFISDINYMTVNPKANPVIAHLTAVHGQQRLHVPIEDGVSAIHISLSHHVNKARFRTPQGYLIDLLNITDVARFARDSYVLRTGETFEIELAIGGSNAAAGVWRLETDAFAQRRYDIVISARHDLSVESKVVGDDATGQQSGKRRLHLNILGDYAKIDNVTLIKSNGERLNNHNIRIAIKENTKNADDIETFKASSNVDIDLGELPSEKIYIQVHGKDKTGHEFQRISYYNPTNIHNVIEPTTVHLGKASELRPTPGTASNVLYEVTNNRNNVIFLRFQVTDQRSYLRHLSPMWAWINPHQTIAVTLIMLSRGGSDLVTFHAFNGPDRITKSAIVNGIGDNSRMGYDDQSPHLWHKYTSNCHEVVFSSCEQHSWTMEVTAQDQESGLLLLRSSPDGLYFPKGYVSGTTEEVTGYMSGSCCHSSAVLTAVDVYDNQRSYVADAYWATLAGGSIAAIVVGVLLILFLILLLVYCCMCGVCKRKQKASHDIPEATSYRGPVESQSTRRY